MLIYCVVESTYSQSKLCIRYITIETKETTHIGLYMFLFPHEYSGEGRGACM